MYTRLIVAAATLTLACLSASAEVYKWVDDSGKVHYSDRPMDDDAAALHIDSRPTDNARIAEQKQARVEQLAQESEEQAKAQEQALKDQEDQARMDENCRRAREAYASMQNAQRLYVPEADGGRRYLNDEEVQARLDRAQNDVNEWCGN